MAILGNADLIQLELTPGSSIHARLEDMIQAIHRAADLCKQMLAYSGKGQFFIEEIELEKIIKEMSQILMVSISKKIRFHYDFAKGIPPIRGDVTQMHQIIMNLITNASEAIGDESGVITISTGAMECNQKYLNETFISEKLQAGIYAYYEITDTGCGMTKETREKIFDPFFTTKFVGRGLGLSAILGIVRGHRGAIKIYSEPGKGTSIKVLFPAVAQKAKIPPVDSEKEAEPWRPRGTILLIDDEESILRVGRLYLERMGFQVLTASDGRKGIEVLAQHEKDIACIILDLTMPNMDGEEAFREIRKTHRDMRVLISSGYNEQHIAQRFTGKGQSGFIQKPYRAQDLLKKLRQVLE